MCKSMLRIGEEWVEWLIVAQNQSPNCALSMRIFYNTVCFIEKMMIEMSIFCFPVVIAGDCASSALSSSVATPPSQSQSLHSNSYQSSNSSADSLGLMVQVCIKMIRVRLELDCGGGVLEMFGVGGAKSGAVFMQAYQEYASQVAQLERNICSYLKVLYSSLNL